MKYEPECLPKWQVITSWHWIFLRVRMQRKKKFLFIFQKVQMVDLMLWKDNVDHQPQIGRKPSSPSRTAGREIKRCRGRDFEFIQNFSRF